MVFSRPLPGPVLELCALLEARGLPTYWHGEALLANLRTQDSNHSSLPNTANTASDFPSLLCAGSATDILRVLPRAVVTAENAARLTQSTSCGPVDVIVCGGGTIEKTLDAFGLGPFGFAFRPADESWIDPKDQRAALAESRLELMHTDPNPFLIAPRRYWIVARLIAEHGLVATPECLAAATTALDVVGARLPQAAPARREISRILDSANPGPGLAFLRQTGVSALLFPGTKPTNEERVALLPRLPAVRWAAWLRGSTTSRALVRLRTPHLLARRIERIQAHHPIEPVVESGREHGVRKLMQRLGSDEIAALFVWRRLELLSAKDRAEADKVEIRLASIEARIEEARAAEARTGRVRALALDGNEVMLALGAGPGRHVGQALAHLAEFVSKRPELNTAADLQAELSEWAEKSGLPLD